MPRNMQKRKSAKKKKEQEQKGKRTTIVINGNVVLDETKKREILECCMVQDVTVEKLKSYAIEIVMALKENYFEKEMIGYGFVRSKLEVEEYEGIVLLDPSKNPKHRGIFWSSVDDNIYLTGKGIDGLFAFPKNILSLPEKIREHIDAFAATLHLKGEELRSQGHVTEIEEDE